MKWYPHYPERHYRVLIRREGWHIIWSLEEWDRSYWRYLDKHGRALSKRKAVKKARASIPVELYLPSHRRVA